MRFTAIILLATALHVSATGMAQKVTLHYENVPVKKIFREIIRQTGVSIIYKDLQLQRLANVSINVKDASIEDVLKACFKNQPYSFRIANNAVVIRQIPVEEQPVQLVQETPLLTISGRVIDENGNPLEGVSVVAKQGNRNSGSTVTDKQGLFTLPGLKMDITYDLHFSYVGYEPYIQKNVLLKDDIGALLIRLAKKENTLNEVTIGYGVVRKSDLTGSVSSISSKTLEKLQLTTIDDALRGNAAGVSVAQTSGAPGGEITVRIRGNNSIQGNNSPLYVVDGLPIQGGINNVNPNSIKSIEVLKDASATAIYGARAANGVVIITTQQGVKGESNIAFSVNTGVENIIRKLNMLNGEQYANLSNEAATNEGKTPVFDLTNLKNANTDWQDLIYTSGFREDYNLTFSGGSEKSIYSVMGNVLNIKGSLSGTGFRRQSLQFNFTHNVRNWLKVVNHYNLNHTKTNSASGGRPDNIGGNSRNTSISSALAAPPIFAPFDENGNYSSLNPYPFIEKILHPIALIRERTDVDNGYNFFGTTGLSFLLTDELKFEIKGGINYKDTRSDLFQTSKLNPGTKNSGSIENHNSLYWLFQSTINYDKAINSKNKISALAGFTSEEQKDKYLQASGSDFPNENTTNQSLQSATTIGIPQSSTAQFRLLSYLGRINYSFLDRYLFTATGRYDGSSRLGPNKKYGFFPSFAAGWKLTEEDFIKELNVFSTLKLRMSWGITGNTNISPYLSLAGFTVTQSFIDGPSNLAIGYAPSNLANTDLKWEGTKQFDFGLDFGFFKNRLNFSADYYRKKTEDLLALVNLPQSSGFTSILSNIGTVENNGFEFQANAVIIDNGRLYFSSGLTFSSNRNKVIKTSNHDPIFGDKQNVFPAITVSKEGFPISSFWGMVRQDLLTEDGRDQFVDINNDGQITAEDNTIIGSPHPDFIYSLSSNFEYKNFTIDFIFDGVRGNDIFNYSKMELNDTYSKGGNMTTDVLDRWSPANPDRTAAYQRMGTSTFPTPTAQFVEDGSYLRLRQLTIGYNLNLNKSYIKYARVYVRAVNLLTITNYSGYDPEVNTFGNNALNFGIDRNSYPGVKSFSVGLNISL